jgi:hypothetical protein
MMKARRGGVIVLVAASVAMLLGAGAMVVDLGAGLASRTRQQAATDAGALAAAYQLAGTPNASAVAQTAVDWSGRNGAKVAQADVSLWRQAGGEPAVTVRSKERVDAAFARFFGISGYDVAVNSSATLRGVAEIPTGAVPIGVPARKGCGGDWEVLTEPGGCYHELRSDPPTKLTLEVSPRCTPEGNFLALAVGDRGLDAYRSALKDGAAKPIPFGTRMDTEAGSDPTPTLRGMQDRLAKPGGDRMLVPLIAEKDWSSREFHSEATVVGVMAVRVTGLGRHGEIEARFEPTVVAAAGSSTANASPGVMAPVLIDTPASVATTAAR